MTHQAPVSRIGAVDPGRQVAQLREVLSLVDRIAGREGSGRSEEDLEVAAQVSSAYERSLPVAQRRFDVLAGDTAHWAATGVEALIAAAESAPPRAAAARLAVQLERAIEELLSIIRS